jgi:hypothetical protein
MLAALVVLLFGGILFFATRREEKIIVVGDLTATDLAEIKRVVHAEMLREVSLTFSWKNAVQCPAAAMRFLQDKITVIYPVEDGTQFVAIGEPVTAGEGVVVGHRGFPVRKGTNGWDLARREPKLSYPVSIPYKH